MGEHESMTDQTDMDSRMRHLEERQIRLEGRVNGHEDLCAERYRGIFEQLKQLKIWQWGIIAAALGGGPAISRILSGLGGS